MKITGTTRITGVFGYPVKHSLSPVFQNAAFGNLGLDCIYIPLEIKPENLDKGIEAIRTFSFLGVNVTIPHKIHIVDFLDEVDSKVEILGVANTVHNIDGKLKGYTTDGDGFIRSLKEDGKYDPRNKNVFLFGAGGSSYAISGALAKQGINKLFLCNRTHAKTLRLQKYLEDKLGFTRSEVIPFEERNERLPKQGIDLVVNTTSIGMEKEQIRLVEPENFHSGMFIYDIVYNRKTELIRCSENLKIPHLAGLSMLIYQGAVSFEIWTGEKAPIEVMKQSLSNIR